ncbi:MAG: nucleoside phosphorylase [Chitinophagales bacterium]|nr:nucleoside phosphorylase [Chitinophagales bacterium]
MKIEESELILNSRGSAYHLDLLPEEISNIIITVGDPGRVAQVSKYFDSVEVQRQKREFVTHTGLLGKKRITVISTGIGTDNIDIVFTELDALVNIDFKTRTTKEELTKLFFMRIGTCGSLQTDIEVDSFVGSEYALGMDNLLHFYLRDHTPVEKEMLLAFMEHVQEYPISFIPYIAAGSSTLLSHFYAEVTKGITVSCPGFFGPQGRAVRAQPSFPELNNQLSTFTFGGHRIVNFDMETSGIYGLSKLLGHEAISLNAVIVNRIERKFSNDPDKAVDGLIKFTLEKIAESTL